MIGTSSPRRELLLKARRPDLRMVPIRGNVPTRLSKIAAGGSYDATVLAAAGLVRLGHDISFGSLEVDGFRLGLEVLDWMLPAPGQGAIAVETREGDRAAELAEVLNHTATARCVEAERLVLKHLGGGCHLALGALGSESGGLISLRAVFVPDKADPAQAAQSIRSAIRSGEASSPTPAGAARTVADQLLFP